MLVWLRTRCVFDFSIAESAPFILMLRPRSGGDQWIGAEEFSFAPAVAAAEYTDSFGNLCQRIVAPPGRFRIQTSARVRVPDAHDVGHGAPFVPVHDLPSHVLTYLLPSRYCEADRFGELAQTIGGAVLPGYDQVVSIVEYVRSTTTYAPGMGQEIISACEVQQRSQAVCRDMAHLSIALCRALSIPARIVVGFLEGLNPMDLHAWFEAYVGGRWYTFDPSHNSLSGGRVCVAYGRDAADVAIYTQFGEPVELIHMKVGVSRCV